MEGWGNGEGSSKHLEETPPPFGRWFHSKWKRITNCAPSLSLHARNKQLQKLFRVHVGANLGVGLDLFKALDDITVATRKVVKDIFLEFVAAVGNGLATREFPARFDVHMHEGCFDDAGVDGNTDGEGIIHRSARIAELFSELNEELGDLVDEIIHGAVSLAELSEIFAGKESFVADVEANHCERPASLEDNLRGFGIAVDVGFGGGGGVAAGN